MAGLAQLGTWLLISLLQIEIKGCSDIGFRLEAKVSAVAFDNGLCNAQTEARSVLLPRIGNVRPGKFFKYLLLKVFSVL